MNPCPKATELDRGHAMGVGEAGCGKPCIFITCPFPPRRQNLVAVTKKPNSSKGLTFKSNSRWGWSQVGRDSERFFAFGAGWGRKAVSPGV